ncbi:MAG: membrane dipeptidase [Verrucomicrobiota bacterium]|nr:membrane dipeptidase [Verrucomicrobiota bacterium]
MFMLDAHLDLAMNAMEWNRDLRQPLALVREREAGWKDKPDRGRGVLTFPEMRAGQVGLCVATQIARHVKPGSKLTGWHSPEQAWAQTQAQLAWYRAMEEQGELIQITNRQQLESHVNRWMDPGDHARSADGGAQGSIGYILSLEGADSIVNPSFLERSYAQGLRAIGLGHYGPGTYAPGTGAEGGLSAAGKELLREMSRLGLILDLTHLSDEAFWEALDLFDGPLWASHCNCRALVPHQRQLSDTQIQAIVERQGVIGVVFDAWMLHVGWERGITTPASADLKLERILEHIDHMCQLTGNAGHVGIGSDLDGGYGTEQCPEGIDTIADLQKLEDLLSGRGYSVEDIRAIFHGNFLNALRRAWD